VRDVLRWPIRPSKTQHRILGRRLRWTEKSKRYRIEMFPEDGDPMYIVLINNGDWRVIAHRRKLRLAKSYCQNHLKRNEGEVHASRG
jgi:hypothetical protein